MKLRCFRSKINDELYISIIKDILFNNEVISMNDFIQHGKTTTLQHCINVSYVSYKIARFLNLDYKSVARASLLHDFYLYDWHDDIPKEIDRLGKHAFYHPKVALGNALRIMKLNRLERDIIIRHMWPVTIILPKFKESWLVSLVDKYCAIYEFVIDRFSK